MKKGFSTLFIVIILGSIALAFALWISTTNLWSIRASLDDRSANQAKSLVNACAEVALESLRENNGYAGTSNVTIGTDACTYIVTNTGGNNRLISVSGAVGNIVRKLQVTTNAFNPLTVSSWQEVS